MLNKKVRILKKKKKKKKLIIPNYDAKIGFDNLTK